jgi:hypothetical protein
MEIILIIIVLAAEIFLSKFWVAFYFKTGIPIFLKNRKLRGARLNTMDVQQIIDLLESQPSRSCDYKIIDPNHIAFRLNPELEGSFGRYTPIMRGLITIDRIHDTVKITGYLYYFPIVFLAIAIFASNFDIAIFIFALPFVVAVVIAVYYFERDRFIKVSDYLTKEL